MARITDLTDTDTPSGSTEHLGGTSAPPSTLNRRKVESNSSLGSQGSSHVPNAPPSTLNRPSKSGAEKPRKSSLVNEHRLRDGDQELEDHIDYTFMAAIVTLVLTTVFASLNILLYQQFSIPLRYNLHDHHFIQLIKRCAKVAPCLMGIVYFTIKHKNTHLTQVALFALSVVTGAVMLNIMHRKQASYTEMEMTPGLGNARFFYAIAHFSAYRLLWRHKFCIALQIYLQLMYDD